MASTKPPNAYRRQKHEKHLKDWASNLKTAVDSLLPSNIKPYRQVVVIAFHWDNDDIGVSGLEDDLLKVFRSKYNFITESYTIPTANCAMSLAHKLVNWSQSWDQPDVLRIYVYSGYAGHAGSDSKWYIAGRSGPYGLIGPRIDWDSIRGGFEGGVGDTCYIFDCCSAGSLAMYDGPELLAAGEIGWEREASKSSPFSFSQTLIQYLNDLNGQPCTVANLYAMIFREGVQNQVGTCPVHVPKKGSPSIILSRVPGASDPMQGSLQLHGKSEHRVLLSVQIEDDIQGPDLQQWTTWLTDNIPSGLLSVDIQIEAYFKGSSLLLVTVPVEVWTMLPADNSALNFVAHVRSNNILPQMMSSITSSLPMRPPPLPSLDSPSGGSPRPTGRENG